jgi:hypothetical protein
MISGRFIRPRRSASTVRRSAPRCCIQLAARSGQGRRDPAPGCSQDSQRYASEAEDHQGHGAGARSIWRRSTPSAGRSRFDLGEGFLELGLVMSSLYFLSRKRFFVLLGGVGAVAGTIIGVAGWFS